MKRPTPPRGPACAVRTALLVGLLAIAGGRLDAGQAHAGRAPRLPEAAEAVLDGAATDRSAAIERLEAMIDEVSEAERDLLVLHIAEQHRLGGDPDRARRLFASLAADAPAMAPAARLGVALLDAERDLDGGALAVLVDTPEKAGLPSQNVDRYAWLAVRAMEGQGGDAATWTRKALAWADDDPALERRLEARLRGDAVVDVQPATPPGPPASAGPGGTSGAPASSVPRAPGSAGALLDAARTALADGRLEEAGRLAADAMATGDPAVQEVGAFILQQTNLPPVDATKVGVLLPLEGRFASVGGQLRDAIVDGWSQVARPEQLVFIATDGSAASAVAGLDTLVLEHHVVAVLGPVRADATEPVAQRAQDLGVPLISMSQSLDDVSRWPWVFQGWVTPRQQVRALLDVTMMDRHLREFAIYAPDSAYGDLAADLFTEEVTRRGGLVKVRVDYPAETKAHGEHVVKLRMPDADGAAPAPWYDAIFVPDVGSKVILAGAAMTGQEISVGEFRAQKREPVPLLGLSAWSRYELIDAGAAPLRGGLFTEVYLPPPTSTEHVWHPQPAWGAFHDRFLATYGRPPTSAEAIASDLGRLAGTVFAERPSDRVTFRELLLSARPAGTVTALRGFDPQTRLLEREIAVHSVTHNGLPPLPAPIAPSPAPLTP